MPRTRKNKTALRAAELLEKKQQIEAEIEEIYRTAAREKWRQHRDVVDELCELVGTQIAGEEF